MAGNITNNFGSLDVVFASGSGSVLKDINGKEYIDFVSGIGVNCLGHNHPKLTNTIIEQAKKQLHISNYYNSDKGLEYAEKLLQATNFDKVYFCNSGAEANEAAIKLARKHGYQTGGEKKKTIITLESSFHGRTMATLSATGQDKFHPDCFAPYVDGFKVIKANDFNALHAAFDDSVCALLIECVQGEGGVNLVETAWAKEAAKLARSVGAVVIADEVQTGIGRTGSFLASDELEIHAEIVTLAKGIAGGIPMGACIYRDSVKDTFVAGDHQSTFGGNPLACAAAITVLEEVTSSTFLSQVKKKGTFIQKEIENWNLSCIKNVRGKGLMIGLDIVQSASDVQKKCLESGLCISTAGAHTVRFLPPLVITENEIQKGLIILKTVLENVSK